MSEYFSSLFSVPAPVANVMGPVLQSIWTVWSATWWFFLPIILAMVCWEFWKLYLHVRFLKSIRWKVLEIKVPKTIMKTPKAMEQIFAAAHAPYSYGIRKYDQYIKGVEEYFMSFELVGRAGETHFYLRVPDQFRNMMEAAVFAQYPDAEIFEVPDYIEEMPHVLPTEHFDVGGFEEIFGKPDWYPLRTYPEFEESVEEQRLDPISPLIEAMGRMTGEQQFWMQLVIVPTGDDWVKKGDEEIRKIHGLEEKKEKKGGFFPKIDLGISFNEALRAPFEHPGESKPKHEEKAAKPMRMVLTSSEKELTEGISRKISKFGFKTTLRFAGLERRGETPGGVDKNMMFGHAYIRQFNTQNMNALRPDKETTSASYSVRGLFRKTRLQWKKRILYERYTHFSQNHHAPILNIEELATIYHFPLGTVSTTQLEKIESRKGSPPATIPLVEDELPS